MNQEHYDILMKGVKVWNEWREGDNRIIPDLRDANLRYTSLRKADLRNADLRNANLSNADFSNADFSYADLSYADLISAKLISAKLRYTNLRYADLHYAGLYYADLRNADLRYTNLSYAILSDANLRNTNLRNTNLRYTNLRNTNLRNADLHYANLSKANLRNTDFINAAFNNTILADLNLTTCQNLDKIRHLGPSEIGQQTLNLCRGQLSEAFLLRVGLKKWEIEAAKLHDPNLSVDQVVDLVYEVERLRNGNPLQIHNLFISYSREDGSFVDRLEPKLRDKDISFWRDIHDATVGPIESILIRALEHNPTVLLIFSKASINSGWVEFEIRRAIELSEKLERNVLCPIALDDAWEDCRLPMKLMDKVKDYNILDFSNWQNATNFNSQFKKLIKGLDLYYRE